MPCRRGVLHVWVLCTSVLPYARLAASGDCASDERASSAPASPTLGRMRPHRLRSRHRCSPPRVAAMTIGHAPACVTAPKHESAAGEARLLPIACATGMSHASVALDHVLRDLDEPDGRRDREPDRGAERHHREMRRSTDRSLATGWDRSWVLKGEYDDEDQRDAAAGQEADAHAPDLRDRADDQRAGHVT